MLSPAILVAYLCSIIFLSYIWFSSDKYWKGFTPSTTAEHIINQIGIKTLTTPYILTRNIWQAQENCVQLDDTLVFKPSISKNCAFENFEFNVTIDHIDGKRVHNTNTKNLDHKRILVLGDSHAMGWGVKNNETFSALLDKHFDSVSFDNMAVSGYGLPRELIVAQNELSSGENYDFILLQYCDNDISEIEYFYKNKNLDKSYVIPIKEGMPIDTIKKNFFVKFMKSIFEIAKHPLFYLDQPLKKKELTDPEAHKGMFSAVLQSFLVGNNFPKIVLFPVNGTVEDTSHLARYLNSEVLMLDKEFKSLIYVVDPLSKIGNKSELFFKLDDHLNSKGHRFIAEQLTKPLTDLLEL